MYIFVLSVLAPQGLQVVQVTDVSLLVEWESVQGAEYYVLTYYPKNDEGAQEQVGFSTLIISVSNTGCSKIKVYYLYHLENCFLSTAY